MSKRLKDILEKVPLREIHGSADREVEMLCIDSRRAGKDSLFVARKGTAIDSHRFIPDVVASGSTVVVCEHLPEEEQENVTFILVDDSDEALGILASNFYDRPSEDLILCGVTGTNGKTTIATLLYKLFMLLGYGTGLVSTVRNMVGQREVAATHTTPDAIAINALLREMADAGCTYCFMEVSSHAIDQKRIAGLVFSGGIFTNLSHDHLDYHGDLRSYLGAKKAFFDMLPEKAFALANADDRQAGVMLQNTKAQKYTYSLKSVSDFSGKVIESHFEGLLINIDGQETWCRLIGHFNAYNLMAVYGAAMLLKQDRQRVLTLLSQLETAEGRFEHMRSDSGVTAIVDYAHSPDALLNILKAINSIRSGNEQLITVIGAGGDRDSSKRPLMGNIAASASDKVILTSDNPRSEDPEEIIREMMGGITASDRKKVISIPDRREAINAACVMAGEDDIILVAGKGHEKYQEIKGVKHPFDDKEILKQILIQTS